MLPSFVPIIYQSSLYTQQALPYFNNNVNSSKSPKLSLSLHLAYLTALMIFKAFSCSVLVDLLKSHEEIFVRGSF